MWYSVLKQEHPDLLSCSFRISCSLNISSDMPKAQFYFIFIRITSTMLSPSPLIFFWNDLSLQMCECAVHTLSVFTPFNLVSCIVGRSTSQYSHGICIRSKLQKPGLLYGCSYIMLPGSSIFEWFILILICNFFWLVIVSSSSFTKFTFGDIRIQFYLIRLVI